MQRLHDVVNKFVLELGVVYSKHTLQDCYYNQISRCPPTSCLPLPTESDKQVEKILHRCLLKKQAILSEQGVLCFSYIYIRPTAEEYQYNIPHKESSSSDALRIFSYTVVLSLNASTAISITDLHTCCMSDFRYFHIVACKTV